MPALSRTKVCGGEIVKMSVGQVYLKIVNINLSEQICLTIQCSGKKKEVIDETKGDLVEVRLGIRRAGGLPDGRDG